ncbi:MAG: 30S ribosomal protein S7 [Flavobacteriales bacterium]|nr:30S ribosomal protein S7 [Bacteroidales bacterium AH-315-I05]PCJ84151.1 MAG: 30S ribosomal protein S7 [Flavobacteriales bacterium]
MRKARAKRHLLSPDPKHKDELAERFVNNIMRQGKKSVAYKIFYDALETVENKTKENGLDVWKKALSNVTPQVEVRSRRVGGATFQIPQEIRQDRKISMGMKWMISYAKQRKGKPMAEKLADEIVAAYKEEGGSFKKKEDIHRMAEANKAFSHFRF